MREQQTENSKGKSLVPYSEDGNGIESHVDPIWDEYICKEGHLWWFVNVGSLVTVYLQ